MRQLRCLVLLLAACRTEDSYGGLSCGDGVPGCLTDALTALRACVSMPDLALGTPTNNSGVVDNLRCTGGDLVVAFSTFSFSPNGTVPLPATITLTVAGSSCATIQMGSGTSMTGGMTKTFDLASIQIPGHDEVRVNDYASGEVGVECSGPSSELMAPASTLTACATSYASPTVVRDDAITMMGVQLVDTTKAAGVLFTCTR